MLRYAFEQGKKDAVKAFIPPQPSLHSVNIKAPTTAPGLPKPRKSSSGKRDLTSPALSSSGNEEDSVGVKAAKVAFNVGMGSSTSHDGTGAERGEPAEEGRRQRSVVDRAFQRNEDDYATSSMPAPGGNVSP